LIFGRKLRFQHGDRAGRFLQMKEHNLPVNWRKRKGVPGLARYGGASTASLSVKNAVAIVA
jgi:hypothetical protein